MTDKFLTPRSISESERSLSNEVEMARKRLAVLEMTASAKERERDALLDEIQSLQRQNNEDDAEITAILLEREQAIIDGSSKKDSVVCALASHEATDEIQRKEKLIQLEKFSISTLEKRIMRIEREIGSYDKQIEVVEGDLEEVHEKTGFSIEKQRQIMEMIKQEESPEDFIAKGEEDYLNDMKNISDLKKEIENQEIEQRELEMLLKNKYAVVERLLAEQEKNEALRKDIARTQNDIRVTDRSIRECTYEKEKRLSQKIMTDTELDAINEHSKFTQSRRALKHDSDYLDELYHSQESQLQDLQRASKIQESHIEVLEKAISVLEKSSKSLGLVGSNYHKEVKSMMRVPPLQTDHKKIVEKYKTMGDSSIENLFPEQSGDKENPVDDFMELIESAHAALIRQSARYLALQEEQDQKLKELKETLKHEIQLKESEEHDQLEETINTARHTEALKEQLGAQQEHINEQLRSPLKRRVMMQRKLSENAPR